MKTLHKLLIIIAVFTVIYLLWKKYTFNKKLEGFENQLNQSQSYDLYLQDISRQLEISTDRIKNFKIEGTPENESTFKIIFEIHPKGIFESNQPLINEITSKLNTIKTEKKPFKINYQGSDIYLAEINYKDKKYQNKSNKVDRQYINPELKPQIKYLEDQNQGIPHDPVLDRSYRFNNGELVLDPLITPVPSIMPDIEPTNFPTPSS